MPAGLQTVRDDARAGTASGDLYHGSSAFPPPRHGLFSRAREDKSTPPFFLLMLLLLLTAEPFFLSFARGVLILCRWPRPDEALVTFATPALARQAVSARNNRSTVLLVELLSRTREEKRINYRRGKEAKVQTPASCSRESRLGAGGNEESRAVSGFTSPTCSFLPALPRPPASDAPPQQAFKTLVVSWRMFSQSDGTWAKLLKNMHELKRLLPKRLKTPIEVELARPGRPPADASSGSRLILGALGIRRPKPKTSDATAAARKSASSKGGIRGRGAKHAQAPPAESTDSWDM